ncbi:MAG: mercury(II) reductase [Candidatus Micrarchaeaceae archaeon]
MENFDYAIIGQGSAAFSAAIKANELGIKTVMIGKNETEGALLGGTCVNVGCVPSKRIITVARFVKELKEKKFDGIGYDIGSIEYEKIVEQKDAVTKQLRELKYEKVLAVLENVSFINEFGRFSSENTIIAGKKQISAKRVLIATGARANIPDIPGIDKVKYLDNESALSLRKLPESMIVVGGRAQGLEFAQMFSMLGTKVTLLQRSETILPTWEPIIATYLEKYLKNDGINLLTNASIAKLSESSGKVTAEIKTANGISTIEAEKILFATGRRPNIEKLNLGSANVKTNEGGFVSINDHMQTSNEHVYAAGDVTGSPMLETLAAKEGNIATVNAFGKDSRTIKIEEIPNAVFTEPEAAMVGKTESQVIKELNNCGCNALPVSMVAKASIISNTKGVIKVVINPETHEILGVHMLAHGAADLIHEGVLAVKFHMKLEDIIDTVHVFPTMSEGFKLACQSFFTDISKQSCCTI